MPSRIRRLLSGNVPRRSIALTAFNFDQPPLCRLEVLSAGFDIRSAAENWVVNNENYEKKEERKKEKKKRDDFSCLGEGGRRLTTLKMKIKKTNCIVSVLVLVLVLVKYMYLYLYLSKHIHGGATEGRKKRSAHAQRNYRYSTLKIDLTSLRTLR